MFPLQPNSQNWLVLETEEPDDGHHITVSGLSREKVDKFGHLTTGPSPA